MKKISEQYDEVSIAKKLISIIIPSCFSIISIVIGLLEIKNDLKILLIVGINIIGIVMGVLITYIIYRVSDYSTYKSNRKYYDNLNLSFYAKEFKKELTIINTEGTGNVRLEYKLQNISNRQFNNIKKVIKYDGKFIEDEFLLQVDKDVYDWEKLKTISKEPLEPKIIANDYEKQLNIHIPFKNFLRPKDTAFISLQYSLTNVFPIFKEGKVDYSSIKIGYPIDRVKLIIKLKNNENEKRLSDNEKLGDFILIFDKIRVYIDTILTRDRWEEFRITKDLKLQGNQAKELYWEFDNPKVGNSYNLYFSCKKK